MYSPDRLIKALWQCYIESGADTDGMTVLDGPQAIRDFPEHVVEAVAELRKDYSDCCDDCLRGN